MNTVTYLGQTLEVEFVPLELLDGELIRGWTRQPGPNVSYSGCLTIPFLSGVVTRCRKVKVRRRGVRWNVSAETNASESRDSDAAQERNLLPDRIR